MWINNIENVLLVTAPEDSELKLYVKKTTDTEYTEIDKDFTYIEDNEFIINLTLSTGYYVFKIENTKYDEVEKTLVKVWSENEIPVNRIELIKDLITFN